MAKEKGQNHEGHRGENLSLTKVNCTAQTSAEKTETQQKTRFGAIPRDNIYIYG